MVLGVTLLLLAVFFIVNDNLYWDIASYNRDAARRLPPAKMPKHTPYR